jgi:hypothetical protein
MASAKVYLELDSIQAQVKATVREVMADAEQVRLLVRSVESQAADMFADCGVEELRRIAALVRAQTLGMLVSAARLAGRAERLDAIADVRDLGLTAEETAPA